MKEIEIIYKNKYKLLYDKLKTQFTNLKNEFETYKNNYSKSDVDRILELNQLRSEYEVYRSNYHINDSEIIPNAVVNNTTHSHSTSIQELIQQHKEEIANIRTDYELKIRTISQNYRRLNETYDKLIIQFDRIFSNYSN
jgi:hypothetical protein